MGLRSTDQAATALLSMPRWLGVYCEPRSRSAMQCAHRREELRNPSPRRCADETLFLTKEALFPREFSDPDGSRFLPAVQIARGNDRFHHSGNFRIRVTCA